MNPTTPPDPIHNAPGGPETTGSRAARQLAKAIDSLSGLVEAYLRLILLEIRERTADALAVVVMVVAGLIMLSFAVLLLSVAVALWLPHQFGWPLFAGFLAVAGVYVLFLLLTFALRNQIRAAFQQLIDRLSDSPNSEMPENPTV